MYESKKDNSVKAEVIKEDTHYSTVILQYLTGKDAGKSVSITTSTLKRWWKKIDSVIEKSPEDILHLDSEVINTPYPEPKVQKYIKKPQSVIEYEEKSKPKNRIANTVLPSHDEMAEQFGSILAKINKTYIVFKNGCWLERKSGYTNLYATEVVWQALSEKGLTSRINGMKNTNLKFVIRIDTLEQYETVSEVLRNV